MRGEMGVVSREGEGSDFWFELPAIQGSVDESVLAEPAVVKKDIDSVARKHSVLYIEDNPANQRLLQELFEDLPGIELVCVSDAEQGIEFACSESPDLILMDIDLPGMSGFDARHILSRNPLTRTIPVLAISAAASAGNKRRAREAGFIDYLTKPVDIQALVHQIEKILAQGMSQGASQ
jgi:CheY-like chemotaxis protein